MNWWPAAIIIHYFLELRFFLIIFFFNKHTKYLYPWYKLKRNMQSVFQVHWLMRGGNKHSSHSPVERHVKHIYHLPCSLTVSSSLTASIPFSVDPPTLSESLSLNLLSNFTCLVPFQMPTVPFVLPNSFVSQSIILVLPTAHSPTTVISPLWISEAWWQAGALL